jgi:transcriptional regulator of arginine metabolism
MKARRQSAILEIIAAEPVTSQEQLRERLRERGIEATQATLSRDVRDLGLVKHAADGAYRRAGDREVDSARATGVFERAVADYLRSLDAVEQLLVLKTDPGQAQPLAVALDRSRIAEIVGTIAGDDTISASTSSMRSARRCARWWRARGGGRGSPSPICGSR